MNGSRKHQIIEKVTEVVDNALHPPSFETLKAIIEPSFHPLSEFDVNLIERLTESIHGCSFAVLELLELNCERLLDEEWLMDLNEIVMDFVGPAQMEIMYGTGDNFRWNRKVGSHLKKIFKHTTVDGFKQRDLSYRGASLKRYQSTPQEWAMENHYLDFAVYWDGNLIYCIPKGSPGKANVNEIWRTVCRFDVSPLQAQRTQDWKQFVETLPEVPFPGQFNLEFVGQQYVPFVSRLCDEKEFPVNISIQPPVAKQNIKCALVNRLHTVDVLDNQISLANWKFTAPWATLQRPWSNNLRKNEIALLCIIETLKGDWLKYIYQQLGYEGLARPFENHF